MPQQPGTIPPSPLQQPPSSYPSWPGVAGAPFQPPPQPDRPMAPPPPPSPFQHWLIRTFQPSLAGNAILGIVLGALVAVVLGGAIAVILEAIFHALAPSFGINGNFGASGQDILDYSLGLIPLHAPFRDGMQLFFLMHGFAGHLQYTPGGSFNFNATLNGLLIIPALALTLGGYIAASTDLQNRAVSSLLRGAAIAIPYAALLIALAPQVNGNLPLFPGEPTTDVNTFTIDSTSLLLYGLIWGAIFGLLGATLKLGRGRWRHMVVQFLHTRPRPQIVGMLTGGLAASGLGILLSMLVLYGFLAFSAFSVPIFTQNLCNFGFGLANWQYMTGWAIAQGPLHAVNLFFYSFGAPVNIVNPKSLNQGCFYINSLTGSDHVTYSLLGGSPHLPNWTFVFLAIPVVSLFLGGRVSAAFGKAQTSGQGLVQGALIAVPFTILMMLLSVFTMIVLQDTGTFNSGSSTNTTLTQSFGVAPFDLLLWALLSGAVLGGLGGIYQTSSFKQSVRGTLSPFAGLLRWLGTPGYALFNRLRGGNRSAPRTTALWLLYGAAFSALILVIAVGVAAVYFISLNQSVPSDVITRTRDIMSTLLVALPGLLLISAAVAALTEEKVPQVQAVMAAPPFMPTGPMGGPMPPVPPVPPQYPPQSYPNYQGGV
ncbi:MAG TPA: hypothetical protein VEL72_02260 [Ktedonobacteraceae bacterium]|nr:hypothetical protein [Ktedonobacteraceae bacterium]